MQRHVPLGGASLMPHVCWGGPGASGVARRGRGPLSSQRPPPAMGRSAGSACRSGPAPSSRGGRSWSHGSSAVPTAGPAHHRQDAPGPAVARASSRVRGGGAPEDGSCTTHGLLDFGRQAGQCGLRTPYASVPAPPDRGWCRRCSVEGMCGLLSLHDDASGGSETRALRGKGAPLPPEAMHRWLRWSVAYPLRPRHGEARLEERGLRGQRVSCLAVCAHR